MSTKVVNMNTYPVPVALKDQAGKLDYVTVAARGKVTLQAGVEVDPNWLAGNPKIIVTTEGV
jgi:hypothetical protein